MAPLLNTALGGYWGGTRIRRLYRGDQLIVGRINHVTNPDAEAFGAVATTRINRATHATAKAYVTAAGANLGWTNTRWFGSSGTGSYTLVTDAVDGPLPTITSYARKTWATSPVSSGDTGVATNNWTGYTAGAVYVISGWIRSTLARSSVGWDVWMYDATGVVQRMNVSSGVIAADTWTRFSVAFTAPLAGSGATYMVANLDTDNAVTIPVGTVTDVAGLLVEEYHPSLVPAATRTNLHANPSVHRNTTNWNENAAGGTWTITRETAAGATNGATTLPYAGSHPWFKALNTVANTVADVGINTNNIGAGTGGKAAVVAGQDYQLAAYWVSSISVGVRLVWRWFDAAGVQVGSTILGGLTTPAANVWSRLVSGLTTAPAGAAYVALAIRSTGAVGAFTPGTYVGATAAQVERVTVLGSYFDGMSTGTAATEYAWTGAVMSSTSVQRGTPGAALLPYFDGSTAPETDFTYAFSGTADASTSLQRATAVAGNVSGYGVSSTRWSSTAEHDTGSRSLAVMPVSITAQVGYYWTVSPLVVQAGQWVTGVVRVKAPVGYNLSLSVRTAPGGGVGFVNLTGTGDWQTVTTTGQAATTGGIIGVQIINRAALQPGIPFYVDRVMMVVANETYTGPYRDGTFPGWGWDGVANASTSSGWN